MSVSRYFHTLRYLRPVQIFGRAAFRLRRPKPDLRRAPALRPADGAWTKPAERSPRQTGPARFRFLNVEREIRERGDWNNSSWQRLWLYNLHYFDDLTAYDHDVRRAWHQALIERWIAENPPGSGVGWEPYPLSLRIVNWIKWALAGNSLSQSATQSLAVQCRYLRRRLEYHLLGNHLLSNAKALMFGGLFFEGAEADKWIKSALTILAQQVSEQILADGGHFERSPMYHALVLEDMLDLVNINRTYACALPSAQLHAAYAERAQGMLRWLEIMTHPDGQISLFNDAAFDIAPTPANIESYAQRLGIGYNPGRRPTSHLSDSGYVRLEKSSAIAILDVGRIGPDYLPGHAHADTLSFELTLSGRRIIVDSGTSTYEPGVERLRQRSTAAHNTVEIDGQDSSEVWNSFRVARRAYPRALEIAEEPDVLRVRCAHDGYRRLAGRPIHTREWILRRGAMLEVWDLVTGGFKKAVARFHFDPHCLILHCDEQRGALAASNMLKIQWSIQNGSGRIVESSFHPAFGVSVPNKCLEVTLVAREARTIFEWTER